MKSNKVFLLFLVFALAFVMLAGCSGGSKGSESEQPDTTQTTNTDQPADDREEPAAEKPAWQTEPITLKFASWEDPNMEAAMMKAFMEKYPNITVVKDESINWPWTDALANAASAGTLPDVFWMENAAVAANNEWLLDMQPYWEADPETQTLFPNIAKQGVYNGKRLAHPTFQFLFGVFLNKTLFEKSNLPLPSYNWTIDEMLEAAKALAKPDEHIYGIAGAWGSLMFEEHFPMANDKSIGYNTWDGEKFHFTNQQWIDAYNTRLELRRLKVEEQMTGEEKKEVFGDEGAWPFMKGNVAMQIDGSWNLTWLPAEMEKAGAGQIDFYPYPAGAAGQRMPAVLDFIGISAGTEHPEAAYELMKFMSWSKEGWTKRLELYKELGIAVDKFPVADQPEIWDALGGMMPTEGVKAAFALMKDAVPDFNKALAGWSEYKQWEADQKIGEKIFNGELTPADAAKQMEDKANEIVGQAMATVGK
ncbi:extracellular solute-binding protein [Paenibacillus thermotolerans]|uniref:extracellular solute-binding protein n=1 Tax=Paenibacillus thermotolerans TaxID=3027807 RepID=UPI0023688411|nr:MULTISPECIES: extracellular solute-binding protein [unclassified Paenibacillus]